ncbi:hypothetical protein [Streptomyces yerevanensis]|nr:hypothetical protein [Streptomyces yerevanensis]
MFTQRFSATPLGVRLVDGVPSVYEAQERHGRVDPAAPRVGHAQ